MALEIKLTDKEVAEVQQKLDAGRDKLAPNEAKFLEFILSQAKSAARPKANGPGWLFSWTYRF